MIRRILFTGKLALALVLLAACGDESDQGSSERAQKITQGNSAALAVDFIVVEEVDTVPSIRVAGVLQPGRRAGLGTRQAGAVREVFVEAGDEVAAGQPILDVDARDLQAAVTAARSQRQAADAAWRQTTRNRERFQRLYDEKLVAKVRLEEAELAEENARGVLERVDAEVAATEMTLDYSVLRAPFAGVVAEIIAETGTFVAPGPPLVVFEDRDKLKVEAGIDQASAARLVPEQVLELKVVGFDEPLLSRVQAVLPALNSNRDEAATGLRLRLVIEDPPSALTPGMIAEIKVPAGDSSQRIVLPADALLRRGQLEGVFVIETDAAGQARARLRWVARATGPVDGGHVHILRGLAAGERVVIGDALDELEDDQPVSLRRRTGN